MDNNKLGLAGSTLLIFGLFSPIFTIAYGGVLNFIGGNPQLLSLSLLALGCVGIFACARNEVMRINWVGLGALLLILISFGVAQYRFSQAKVALEDRLAGNPFAQKALDSFSSPQIDWGWLLLIAGTGVVLYASLGERKAAGIDALSFTDQTDKNYGLAAGIPFVVALAALGISEMNSAGASNGTRADAATAVAESSASDAAVKAEANAADEEKRDYIAKHVEVYELEAQYMDSMLDGRIPGVTFKIKNNGGRTLRSVDVTVEFLDAQGKPIAEEVYYPVRAGGYNSSAPLRPGYIWQNERGRFFSAKAVPSEWQSGRARARVSDIEFEGGQ